ncbi:GNAT family N-acetyltransferase [Enterovibrio calviensis]|uniref:GNAT family N-acetyltransferase n=1 Tax=Enterovibrio calviensis TaxID=91359 RepID=UPI00047F0154|nr:GNAT family N-acetyltransferase [Enterovibrio calviensis]
MTFPSVTFRTPRLTAAALSYSSSSQTLNAVSTQLAAILTPDVTRHLPPDIQTVRDKESAANWLSSILNECQFVAVSLVDHDALAGFFLLYPEAIEQESQGDGYLLRLGYVVAERYQGQGLASEMIAGLVAWCRASGVVTALSGGASAENAPSIKVLEKNGFVREENDENHQGDTVFLTLTI